MVHPTQDHLLGLLQSQAVYSLPGLTTRDLQSSAKPMNSRSQQMLGMFEQFFCIVSSIDRIAQSLFPSLSTFTKINLFGEERSEEIAEDGEHRLAIVGEIRRYTEKHRNDANFQLKLRIHLLNFAHKRFEDKVGRTFLLLITSGDLAKPETVEFSKRRWLQVVSLKDSRANCDKWIQELKHTDDNTMRLVIFKMKRPVLSPSSGIAPSPIDEKVNTCFWTILSLLNYADFEKKYQEAFPQGYDLKKPDVAPELRELALRYTLEKTMFLCERIRSRFFQDTIGATLTAPLITNAENLLCSIDDLTNKISLLKIHWIHEGVLPSKQNEGGATSSTSSLKLPDIVKSFFQNKKDRKEENEREEHPFTISLSNPDWRQLVPLWQNLGKTLELLRHLLSVKPLIAPQSHAIKIPTARLVRSNSRKNTKEVTLSPAPGSPHLGGGSMRDPQAPSSPYNRGFSPRMVLADSPDTSPLTSPKGDMTPLRPHGITHDGSTPDLVRSNSATHSRPLSVRQNGSDSSSSGSPRTSIIGDGAATPRSTEIHEMARISSPRTIHHLTTLTDLVTKAENCHEVFTRNMSMLFLTSPIKELCQTSAPTQQNSERHIIPITDFKDIHAQAYRGYLEELLFLLEEQIEVTLLNHQTPNPLITCYLKELETIEFEKYEKEIEPRLKALKQAFDDAYLKKNGTVKEDYDNLWAWEAWKFLKNLCEVDYNKEEQALFLYTEHVRTMPSLYENHLKPFLDKIRQEFEKNFPRKLNESDQSYTRRNTEYVWTKLKKENPAKLPEGIIRSFEEPRYKAFGESGGKFYIPLLDDGLDKPLNRRALRVFLNEDKNSDKNTDVQLEKFLALLNQSTLIDGVLIQLGARDGIHPISCSDSAVAKFWNSFFVFVEQKAKKMKNSPVNHEDISWIILDTEMHILSNIRNVIKDIGVCLPKTDRSNLNLPKRDKSLSDKSLSTCKTIVKEIQSGVDRKLRRMMGDAATADKNWQTWVDSAKGNNRDEIDQKEYPTRLSHLTMRQNLLEGLTRLQERLNSLLTLIDDSIANAKSTTFYSELQPILQTMQEMADLVGTLRTGISCLPFPKVLGDKKINN